ncbi:hypothetical protein BDW59DRAFT_45290 [Aspergillus cavernicola]|uniref:Uncharacterized protein n=1 Tax=Aspergillus cavernicola TaxID=176166 RepID=A0ABR4J2H5_9EURO
MVLKASRPVLRDEIPTAPKVTSTSNKYSKELFNSIDNSDKVLLSESRSSTRHYLITSLFNKEIASGTATDKLTTSTLATIQNVTQHNHPSSTTASTLLAIHHSLTPGFHIRDISCRSRKLVAANLKPGGTSIILPQRLLESRDAT